MVRKAALILAAMSTPAMAQSSQCSWIGNVWSCQQDRAPPVVDYGQLNPQPDLVGAFMEGRRLRAAEDQRRAEAASRNLRARVGQMAAAGDCSGAQSLAVSNGDFDLAGQVRSYCGK